MYDIKVGRSFVSCSVFLLAFLIDIHPASICILGHLCELKSFRIHRDCQISRMNWTNCSLGQRRSREVQIAVHATIVYKVKKYGSSRKMKKWCKKVGIFILKSPDQTPVVTWNHRSDNTGGIKQSIYASSTTAVCRPLALLTLTA